MVTVNLYSETPGQVDKFLSKFYDTSLDIPQELNWKKTYDNPIEIAEIIGTFADNSDDFSVSMWISLDSDIFINITEQNADDIIKYLYERYPY